MQHCFLYFTFDKDDFFTKGDQQYIRDRSGKQNDGLVKNAEPAEGRVREALRIDGNDHHVDVKDNPSLNPTEALTISAWVNPRTFHGGWDGDCVVSKDDWKGPARGYVLRLAESGKFDFTVGSGGWRSVFLPTRQMPNAWVHVAGVYDPQQMRLYVNGMEVKSVDVKKPLRPSPFNLRIGRGTFDTNRRFHGLIDELAIFSAPLTSDEIKTLYAQGQSGQRLMP